MSTVPDDIPRLGDRGDIPRAGSGIPRRPAPGDIPRRARVMPLAVRLTLPVALLALGACLPPRVAGDALAPAPERRTNAVLAHDRATLARWDARLRALASAAVADSSGDRAYALARAAAWLDFAREQYDADPRSTAVDAALAEASRLVLALERADRVDAGGRVAAATAPGGDAATLVAGARVVRPDLWAAARALDSTPAGRIAAAEAEVLLVRAGLVAAATRAMPPGAPTCGPWVHLARAERVIRDAEARLVAARAPLDTATVPTPPTKPFQHGVHFALDSDRLSAQSRAVLDGVVDALSTRLDLTLVIEGHTDPRGNPGYNERLSLRRAEAVRQYLAAGGLQLSRVEVRALGPSRRKATGTTREDYALDRRVVLRFYDDAGTEITGDESRGDLQVEAERRARRAGRPTRQAARPTGRRGR